MTPIPVIEIDGARFNNLEGFWDEVRISRIVITKIAAS
jgi:hypothetical protein